MFKIYRDQGFGRGYVRNADTREEAEKIMAAWMREGMRPDEPGRLGGEFEIREA